MNIYLKKPSILSKSIFNYWFVIILNVSVWTQLVLRLELWQEFTIIILTLVGISLAGISEALYEVMASHNCEDHE